jgi:hypothetical protein
VASNAFQPDGVGCPRCPADLPRLASDHAIRASPVRG